MIVYADLRWPRKTGIGTVQSALLDRRPQDLEIADCGVSGRIGSPLSPVAIARALSHQAVDNGVFWSPGYMPPAWSALASVVTVHDLTHLHHYSQVHALYYNVVMKPLYKRCQRVICVSDFTRNEFLNWSGVNPDVVFTVHNGVHVDFFAKSSGSDLEFPFVLYAGNRRPYKNLDRLLRAFSMSSLPRDGVCLLLTGEPDRQLSEAAVRLHIDHVVRFAGDVTDDVLARLYRSARLVAFVSLYEGFGLPILEAMAASVPVLTSNLSAMPEIAGNAALLVDPMSVEEIARGLERLHYDETSRQTFISLGRANARLFDWNTTAASTWEIVRGANA